MKLTDLFLTSSVVAPTLAKPLFIYSVPGHNVYHPPAITAAAQLVEPRQFLDPIKSVIESALGVTDVSVVDLTTPSSQKTQSVYVGGPLSATTTADSARTTSDSDEDTTTSSEASSTTSQSTKSTSATSSTEATTTPTSTIATPTANLASSTSASLGSEQTSSSDSNGDSVPPGGVAVAVIFPILIIIAGIWLVFHFNTRAKAWLAAWKQRRADTRSYREAIDGPKSEMGSARSSGPHSRRSYLQSFFAPSTVKLGGGKEIRRKPVNWGGSQASSPPATPTLTSKYASIPTAAPGTPRSHAVDDSEERVSITASAAPMGTLDDINPTEVAHALNRRPTVPDTSVDAPNPRPTTPTGVPQRAISNGRPISPVSIKHGRTKSIAESEFSAVSPIAGPVTGDLKDLPPLPPIPMLTPMGTVRVPPSRATSSAAQNGQVGSTAAMAEIKQARKGEDGVFRLQ